jgi:hypothetical protein
MRTTVSPWWSSGRASRHRSRLRRNPQGRLSPRVIASRGGRPVRSQVLPLRVESVAGWGQWDCRTAEASEQRPDRPQVARVAVPLEHRAPLWKQLERALRGRLSGVGPASKARLMHRRDRRSHAYPSELRKLLLGWEHLPANVASTGLAVTVPGSSHSSRPLRMDGALPRCGLLPDQIFFARLH